MHLARMINDPDHDPIPLTQVPDILRTMDHTKMRPLCKHYYLDILQEIGELEIEEEIIASAVQQVMEILST